MLRSLSAVPAKVSVRPLEEGEERPVRSPSGELATPQSKKSEPSVPNPVLASEPVRFAYQAELMNYADLKTIILPDENQKALRKRLLQNADFLRSVGDRLRQRPMLALMEQAAGIDLLVEALRVGEKSIAKDALMAIVADAQVEDQNLPRPEREQMAGVKAEVLFHWLALQPGSMTEAESALPGPVSRKILENVKHQHQSNLAESRVSN